MNRIMSIGTEGWKGLSRTIPVSPLTLIVGNNGSGKTGVLSAVMYGFQGHTLLGKTDDQTAELVGPEGGGVVVTLDDGFEWSRMLTRGQMGLGNKTLVSVAGDRKLGVTKAEAAISARVGDFAPMFNVSEFIGLSDDKKRDFVLNLCSRAGRRGGADPDNMAARILIEFLRGHEDCGKASVDLLLSRAGILSDDQATLLKAKGLLDGLLSPQQANIVREIMDKLIPEITQDLGESVAAALDAATMFANVSKASADGGFKAARELATRKATIEVAAGNLSEINKRRAELREEEKVVIASLNAAIERRKHRTTLVDELNELKRRMMEAGDKLSALKALPFSDGSDIERHETAAKAHEQEATLIDAKVAEFRVELGNKNGALHGLLNDRSVLLAKQNQATVNQTDIGLLRDRLSRIPVHNVSGTAEELRAEAEAMESRPKPTPPERDAMKKKQEELEKSSGEYGSLTSEKHVLATTITYQGAHVRHNPWLKMVKLLDEAHEALGSVYEWTSSHVLTARSVLIPARNLAVENAAEATKEAEQLKENEARLEELNAQIGREKSRRDALQQDYNDLERTAGIQYAAWMDEVAEWDKRVETIGRLRRAADDLLLRSEIDKEIARRQEVVNAWTKDDDAELTSLENGIEDLGPVIIQVEGAIGSYTADARRAWELSKTHARAADSIRQTILLHQKDVEATEQSVVDLQTQIRDSEWRLNRLGDPGVEDAIGSLTGRKAALAEEINKLDQAVKNRTAYDTLESELSACSASAENRQLAYDTAKQIVKSIKVLRESMMVEMTSPLTSLMDEFLGPSRKSFVSLDNPAGGKKVVFRMGWIADRGRDEPFRVTINALSGGERVAFVAALSYALVSMANPPIKLLLIEAGEVSAAFLGMLFECVERVKDKLSNVLIATHVHPAIAPQGWTVHDFDNGKGVS